MKKVLLLLSAIFFFSSETKACPTMELSDHAAQAVNQADLIFIGRAVGSHPHYLGYFFGRYNYFTKFEVDELLKGQSGDTVKIYYINSKLTGATVAFESLKGGEKVIVFANSDDDGVYRFQKCSMNLLFMKHLGPKTGNSVLRELVYRFPNLKDSEVRRAAGSFYKYR